MTQSQKDFNKFWILFYVQSIPIESQVLDFIGYGRIDAPYWFLGLEEGFHKGTRSIKEQYKSRLSYNRVMSLQDAMVKTEGWMNWDEKVRKTRTGTWQFMSKIMLSINGISWLDQRNKSELVRGYIRHKLGDEEGETLLTEILPLPKSSDQEWPDYYGKYYDSIDAYTEQVLPYRENLLRKLIKERRPKLIIAYGETKWSSYLSLFSGISFKEYPNSNGKRRIMIGKSGITVIALTYFLGNAQFLDNDVAHLLKLIQL